MPEASRYPALITTVAGNGQQGFGGDGGPATTSSLNCPFSVTFDSSGDLYIADYQNHRVRKVSTGGTITTVAGNGVKGYGGDGGPATAASLKDPAGVAVDRIGNLYIADRSNQRVRKVGPDGTITTVAGSGTHGFSGDGGPATRARLNFPHSIAVDGAGNLFIADDYNHRLRKVGPDGTITTVAGDGTEGYGGDGGPATRAGLNFPHGIAIDAAGTLYIADRYNYRVRKVTPDGTITTVAGTGTRGFDGDGGPAVRAALNLPQSVALDRAGNLYLADYGNKRVRRVTPDGRITTVAGDGTEGSRGDSGPATSAQLNQPLGIAVDAHGDVHLADYGNHRIRRLRFPASGDGR
ncbi:NHL repeat-containing protein [Kitasatospora purpeofusca]|uniref:NHL repeat-containing protein n=1 Tax=Kitasatospora purpeofusca TaxID=67352 RepID=UPI003695291C